MIKVKLAEIVGSVDQIKSLSELKLPVKISYRLSRLAAKIQPELTIYNEKRNKIIEELGTQNEDKTFSIKDAEKLKEFTVKLKELLEIEIEIDWFEKIKISELGEINVPAKDLIEWVFSE